jgi:hypothetical protein
VELLRVGVDIGQRVDPTAIAITEELTREVAIDTDRRRRESFFLVRQLERLPLDTPYPQVATRIAEVVGRVALQFPSATLWLVLDATGVGRPVVDLIRDELGGTSRVKISAATFVATDRLEGGYRSAELKVGKEWMVSRLQALMQTTRIQLPSTNEAQALANELRVYDAGVSQQGTFTAGAKTGKHDDLVTAVGLSVLEPGRSTRSRLNALSVNSELTGTSVWLDGSRDVAASGPSWGSQPRDDEMLEYGWHRPGLGRQDGGGSW